MIGSESQIKWAENIRSSWIGQSGLEKEKNLFEAIAKKIKPEFINKAKEAIEGIKNIPDAGWWIENRNLLSIHSGNYKDKYLKEAMQLILVTAKYLKLA